MTIAVVAAISMGSASAETIWFPAGVRAAYGLPKVDLPFSVYMHPDCTGRWSLDYPPGFVFSRGGPISGNLYGNPGRGTYDVALKLQACPSKSSDYVDPAHTIWYKIVVD
ncbi:hypothetical protein [Rhizobium leguminosarum]|uniref:hypothetical protein n=1 Tax=Rhizobium leguminosarum TaxID=384 RepID=UPI001C98D38C|nr:hypothetical protein [Rhizobium leguminosarum]MBY5826320.1 hypothetical protein [Rhizobium leguminosarum]